MKFQEKIFSVAPMMDWTDRHCRFFHRILTRRARLYTEMVTTAALMHGNRERLIGFDPAEHPVALQLGGCDARDLAHCARMAEDEGYDEVNLNIGCPSERVQRGAFGACLMREPDLVAECVAAMRAAVRIPVTVKCRIGVDDQEPREALFGFVERIARTGCDTFVVHARKAWLKGLSPKDNREIPPLDYPLVYALKRAHPELTIVINGGITTLDQAREHLSQVDGVMMGRAAYQSPWLIADADRALFGEPKPVESRRDALRKFLPYVERERAKGVPLNAMTKHVLGLFNGLPGARAFRRHLSEHAVRPGAGHAVIETALGHVTEDSAERAAA
ncbi:MAG: tRNA dihydrouridine(20/20a) synthase DusA [Alphaproteobacteria bacterium]|nr:tRNA dihydrouridine(20/20a) synthase DusA [Alphaproteobacteria bacterium]